MAESGFVTLSIRLDTPVIEEGKPYAESGNLYHVPGGGILTGLPDGTARGRPTVALFITLPDGKAVLWETTLTLFLTAADALKAKFGDPRQ